MATANLSTALATIPTDQLVLKLLQELAARVEKLEKRHEADEKTQHVESTASLAEGSEFENESIKTMRIGSEGRVANSPNLVDEQVSQSADMTNEDVPDHQRLSGAMPPHSTVWFDYGSFLDDDYTSIRPIKIEERYAALLQSGCSPEAVQLLKTLAIAVVPADGRMPLGLARLWDSHNLPRIKSAIECGEDLERTRGKFLVADSASNGRAVLYEHLVDERSEPIRSLFPFLLNGWHRGAILVPPIRCVKLAPYMVPSPDSAPWNRVM